MTRATSFLRAGMSGAAPADYVVLGHDERHLRRRLLALSGGEDASSTCPPPPSSSRGTAWCWPMDGWSRSTPPTKT